MSADLNPTRALSAGGVLAAVMLSTAAGAALTALLFAAATLFFPFGEGLAVTVPDLPSAFIVACPIWLAGLVTVGGPCWWLLHRSGVRSLRTAALVGALLTLAVAGRYVVLSPTDNTSDSIGAWTFVAGLTAIGGLAGWVLVKVAYPKGGAR